MTIDADIDAKANSGAGSAHEIVTTGDFDGTLNTHRLEPVGGVATPGVYIGGDMNAVTTVTEDIRVPFEVGGDLNGGVALRDLWIGTASDGSIDMDGNCNADITIASEIQAGANGTAFIDIAGNLAATISVGEHSDGTIAIGGSITSGLIDVSDDINGAITVGNDIEPNGTIACQGDVNANITVTDDLGGLINIGGSLISGKTIAVQSLKFGSVPGQIIVDSLASGTASWAGSVTVNSTALSPTPDYADEDLGGGVGLVPFTLHDGDCYPENEDPHSPNPTSVTLSFRGPVTWASGFPLLIQFHNGTNWEADPYWIMYHDWLGLTGKGTRTLVLLYDGDPPVLPSGRSYRITPYLTGSNALLCDDLFTTNDEPVEDFLYEFDVP